MIYPAHGQVTSVSQVGLAQDNPPKPSKIPDGHSNMHNVFSGSGMEAQIEECYHSWCQEVVAVTVTVE